MPEPHRAVRLLLVTVTALATALGVQGTAAAAPPSGSTPTPTPAVAPSPTPSATDQPTPAATAAPATTNAVAAAAAAAAPVLAVTVTSSPATVARAGQTVTHTVTVKNTGNGVLRDLAVSAVAPGLPAITCTPVAQGGTLYTATTTTCTGRRTSTAEDLRNHGRTVSASAAGFASDGTGVTGTASVRTTVTALAPKVTDDTVTVLPNLTRVVLPGSTNDSPGETGGPAIDGSRTDFPPATGTGAGTRAKVVSHGTFEALANGSIAYVVNLAKGPYLTAWTDTASYRTYDVLGQSAVGTATVVVRRPPLANADTLSGGQGQTVSGDPLTNDGPGQLLDGTRAAFAPGTLRFAAIQPGPGLVSASGDAVTVPNAGRFSVAGEVVTYVPQAPTATPVTVRYQVTNTAGLTAAGSIQVLVNAPEPVGTDDVASTPYATPVELPGALDDTPGAAGHTASFAGFVGRDHADLGLGVGLPQGGWSVAPDGAVVFSPASGFAGTVVQDYRVRDSSGGEAVAALTVTVQRGPTARPDVLATRAGTDGTTNPGANDTPGLRADGSASTFDPRFAVFPDRDQPAGSVVGDQGKTLTLPGRGRLWFANGALTFRPQPGFHGYAGTVAYQLEDTSRGTTQRGVAVVGRLTLLATSAALTATDDSATTSLNRPVTLPAATDDDPGSTTTALRPVFPGSGQPTGAVRSADGLTLTVPGQGTWTATTTAATVTFTPAPGFVDAGSPVTYQISGAGGATATARLLVSVAPGPAAVPDVVTRAEDDRVVDPLLDDFPGRSANGRLGSLVLRTVRFTADGQPVGSVVSNDGHLLQVPSRGSAPTFDATIDPTTGLIGITPGAVFRGTSPPISYSVLSEVADSTGVVSLDPTTSTVRMTFTTGAIVTSDDHVTVRSGRTASLPGASNDSPAPGFFPLDLDGTSFSSIGQPPGSQLHDDPHGHDHEYSLVVPDQGVWHINGGGFLSFVPDAGFVGTTSPVRYAVADFEGLHSGTAAETVTVLPPAVPRADTATTPQGAAVVVHTLANDTPELDPDGHPYGDADLVTVDPARVPTGSTLTAGSGDRQLVVPKQGTYTIDQGTGDVRFVPDPTFRGSATALFLLVPGGSSRFQVTVLDVDPVAEVDAVRAAPGTSVRIRVLDNDAPGTPARPLVPASVRLVPSAVSAPPITTSADGQIAVVPGRGVLAVAGDGTVTLYPLAGATGLTAVGYSVADVNGTRAFAGLQVRVG